jgi:hypothetical protein
MASRGYPQPDPLRSVKRLNPRRVKLHRNYTVGEAARLFHVHKNTVRGWLRSGLETIDDRRPTLIVGGKLSAFLHVRRERRRRRCKPGQLYCVRCRAPKASAGRTVEYLPITSDSGNLRGTCSDCGTHMYRRVSRQKLAAVAGDLEVQLPLAELRIGDTSSPSLNSDFSHEPEAHANAQSGK